MLKKFLQCGKVVGTHGVRGFLRVQPWCDGPDFLCGFNNFYLDENGEKKLAAESIKVHGNICLLKIRGVDSIEDAESLRGKILYIYREDCDLPEGSYFIEDILGSAVIDARTGKELGRLSDVSSTGANDVWHVEKDGREYLVPKIPDINAEVDLENSVIKMIPLRGIFEDED